ncbi:MAG: hypothetical protein HYS21_12045 [Deltaproteobacteria bacterium]|nr:hypothetical protein [Deltaproteobacteria bacterium]
MGEKIQNRFDSYGLYSRASFKKNLKLGLIALVAGFVIFEAISGPVTKVLEPFVSHGFIMALGNLLFLCLGLAIIYMASSRSVEPLSKLADDEQELLKELADNSLHFRSREEKLEKYFGSQHELNQLTKGHLDAVIQQTDEAASHIISQAQDIDSSMNRMQETISELNRECESLAAESGETIAANEKTIADLRAYIGKRAAEVEKDYEIVLTLAEKARSMASLVELLKDISDQTNLLALNAAIEAARAGEHGRGFAIVAGEVRKLSSQSEQAANRIGQAMIQMADDIETKFAVKLNQKNTNTESSLLVNLETQLNNLGDGYRVLDSLNKQILEQVASGSGQVAGQVVELLSNVQFQDIVRQQIELVMKTIEDADNYLKLIGECMKEPELCDGDACRIYDFSLEGIKKHYVMEKQRQVHLEVISGNPKMKANPKRVAQSDITFF